MISIEKDFPHNFSRLGAPTISAPINVVRWVFASGQYMCPPSYAFLISFPCGHLEVQITGHGVTGS